jgi:hypothetical protein
MCRFEVSVKHSALLFAGVSSVMPGELKTSAHASRI